MDGGRSGQRPDGGFDALQQCIPRVRGDRRHLGRAIRDMRRRDCQRARVDADAAQGLRKAETGERVRSVITSSACAPSQRPTALGRATSASPLQRPPDRTGDGAPWDSRESQRIVALGADLRHVPPKAPPHTAAPLVLASNEATLVASEGCRSRNAPRKRLDSLVDAGQDCTGHRFVHPYSESDPWPT